MTDKLFAVHPVPEELAILAIEPLAWTRLEPLSLTGDPAPGLEARVHDALWMLGRQWQFGEFQGEDTGSPTRVRVEAEALPVTAWRPSDDADAAARSLPKHAPLDPFVEQEQPRPENDGLLRQRAEAGMLLVITLADAGLDIRSSLVAACPLPISGPSPSGSAEFAKLPDFFKTLARGAPDGRQAALALEGGTPPWLAGASAAAWAAAADWLGWYRRSVEPNAAPAPTSWLADRLEYRFALRAGSPTQGVALEAPLHLGGAIDWFAFDHRAQAGAVAVPGDGEAGGEDIGAAIPLAKTVLPTPLTYAAMPSDRLWQFEDGGVNFGMLDVQAHDPARLCLVEFAMVFGNDWFLVPLDVPTDAFTRIRKVVYTNSFGEDIEVPACNDGQRSGRFRLFEFSSADNQAQTLPGLLLAPTARQTLEGRPLEEVQFMRDENANLCWALERVVQARSGDPRSRRDEQPSPAPERTDPEPADLTETERWYRLQTPVPGYWVPLVPMPTSSVGGFRLRKGTTTDTDLAKGWLLRGKPYDLHDEEIPREGVTVRRVAELALGTDGTTHRWIARRVSVGRGEGSSGLASDQADPIRR